MFLAEILLSNNWTTEIVLILIFGTWQNTVKIVIGFLY